MAVIAYHSNSRTAGATQLNPRQCLGGERSGTYANTLTAKRNDPISGLVLLHVSGQNGTGNAALAASGSTVYWTKPSGTQGAGVSIANGETKLVADDDTAAYAIVKRTTSNDVDGEEAVQLLDSFNNFAGGPDITDAEASAGVDKYAAIFLYTENAITNLKVWVDNCEVASETPSSGAIQTIADEDTAPTSVTFAGPTTEGTATSIGSLSAGESVGLWRKITTAAGASRSSEIDVHIYWAWDEGGTTYYGEQRGLHRVQVLFTGGAETQGELYAKLGSDPDPDSDSPVATSTSSPIAYTGSYADGTWYRRLYIRNAYGLLSAYADQELHLSGGSDIGTAPRAPDEIKVTAAADGEVLVQAIYYPMLEESSSNRADTWAIWITTDGTNPDPDNDAATDTETMRDTSTWTEASQVPGQQMLYYSTGPYLDQTPIKVVVRTRRDDDSRGSTNSTVYSATASELGLTYPVTTAAQGSYRGIIVIGTPPSNTAEVDATYSVEWRVTETGTALYVGSTLIWRAIWEDGKLYLPTGWSFITGSVSGAATGSDDVIDVVDATELYLLVNGTREAAIDVTAQTVTLNSFSAIVSLPGVHPNVPAHDRYSDSLLAAWDRDDEEYDVWGSIDDSSDMDLAITVDLDSTQAQIEAI